MTVRHEERGSYLIEAGAIDLHNGIHWKPWLRLTRCVDGVSASHSFDGLKPVFGAEQAALRYAAELGRSLVDEGWTQAPAADRQQSATPHPAQSFARARTFALRMRTALFASFTFTAAR